MSGFAAPFYVVVRVGEVPEAGADDTGGGTFDIGAEVGIFAKIRLAEGGILEVGSAINPVATEEGTVVEGAIFEVSDH